MLSLFPQQNEGRRIPKAICEYVNKQQKECHPCQEHAELPRVPKVPMPSPATPNIYVSLDVMLLRIRNQSAQILVILDHGNMMPRLQNLPNSSAATASSANIDRWISIFDAPVFTVVDRRSNLANQLMTESLCNLDSHLCPMPTEATWSLGRNDARTASYNRQSTGCKQALISTQATIHSCSRRSLNPVELHSAPKLDSTTFS